ncbi:MAG: T9SS type A sorting domain-containing protein [Bacteroidales bacterium]|nr:T9SS type A sorting domain-containing protein [Bacteroidales bacterium]
MRKFTILLFLSFLQIAAFAQLNIPGVPASKEYQFKESVVPVRIPFQKPPVRPQTKTNQPQPLVAGYTTSLSDTLMDKGTWQKTPTGVYVWRLALQQEQANALNIYFKNFYLNTGDRLYIYNATGTKILGAFSRLNNGPFFATGYLSGDEIIIELDSPVKYETLPFKLELLGNIKSEKNTTNNGFGGAESCEVPINCPEGANYQKQKRGIARILLLDQGTLYWCTGTLINDTKNDATPYFLTANHCGSSSSISDYNKWLFYFNFESPDCSRPAAEPSSDILVGANLLATAPTTTGSDFKLLLLKNSVPISYKPYFNGWDATGSISNSGVVIHHPEGDIKMISTYTTPVIPMDYTGTYTNPNGLYWRVVWAATQDGHGVTEGGSSGSPLFNSSGLVIGSLTGGTSDCTTPDSPDYFGRFSKSWDANGSDSTVQLKYWLDKNDANISEIPGFDPSSTQATPFFSANVQNVPIGGSVQFANLSTGPITSYHWEFEGGNPSYSNEKTPPLIYYNKPGSYKVSLNVTYPAGQDSLVRASYISVRPVIYPNPTSDGEFHILLGNYDQSKITISIYNMMGQRLNTFSPQFTNDGVSIILPHNQNGLYIIRVTNNGETHSYKVMNFHQ